jgi:hypothetical protein
VEVLDVLAKTWPIAVGLVTVVIVLAKLETRTSVLEEKVKSLFDLINKGK